MNPIRFSLSLLALFGVALCASCSTVDVTEERADPTGGPYQPASAGLSTPLTSPGASAPYGY